jgi:AcrR family transcriptional regulator
MRTVDPKRNEARRTAILEAACRLVGERGYHQVRVQDVAEACGTSTGTVHYYFPGKDDVLREALRFAFERTFERQGTGLKAIADARERLLTLVEMQLPTPGPVRDEWSIWLQFWAESSTVPELRSVHNDFYDRWLNTVERIVVRGQGQGIFREDVDPTAFAQVFTSTTDGLGIKVLTGATGITVETMRDLLINLADTLLGIGAGEAPG